MSKNNHAPGPVPPGNRPHAGPAYTPNDDAAEPTGGPGDQPQDPERRLGGYVGKGEHSRQQPGAANDGDRHNKPNSGPN
jgi:hypothetical protein